MPEETNTNKADAVHIVTGESPSVLIIEDDQFLRDLVSKKLEVSGYTVLQAIDGASGLGILREQRPVAILLDMILPGMGGLEILQLIKNNPETSSIPVFILSNLGQKSDIEKAKELGASGYMVKAHTDLNEIVKTIVDASSGK